MRRPDAQITTEPCSEAEEVSGKHGSFSTWLLRLSGTLEKLTVFRNGLLEERVISVEAHSSLNQKALLSQILVPQGVCDTGQLFNLLLFPLQEISTMKKRTGIKGYLRINYQILVSPQKGKCVVHCKVTTHRQKVKK